ncbi:hypothetical protein [Microcoleus sp. S13_C5]|uniref:hypothetical protein n=1 Tax=Microcoleus sp. S13_C5 TaxID=3055411 RepID=UPI002FD1196D
MQTVADRAQNNEVTLYEWLEYFEQLLKEPEKIFNLWIILGIYLIEMVAKISAKKHMRYF